MMYEPSGQWAQPWARLVLQLAADSIPLEYWFQRALNKNVVLWFSDLITSIRAINELISLRGSKTQRQWNATAIVLRGCANTAFPEADRNGYQPSPVPSRATLESPLVVCGGIQGHPALSGGLLHTEKGAVEQTHTLALLACFSFPLFLCSRFLPLF